MEPVLLIGPASQPMRERLAGSFHLLDWSNCPDRDALMADHAADIRYVVTNGHDGVPAPVMAALTNLGMISCNGVGYDAIDIATALERRILVTHTPGVLSGEVATTAIMLVLACLRNLVTDDAYVRSGRWARDGNPPLSRSVDGRRVGILGLGRIGSATAERLLAFACKIAYHSPQARDVPYRYYQDLVEMAHAVEILICTVPGGSATHHLVNGEVLDALGSDGTLINVSRGSVVDEPALIAALSEGRLGRAGLDVFANEPNVPQPLLDMPNVVLLPHVGSATVETRARMDDLTVDNLIAFATRGEVLTPVPECSG